MKRSTICCCASLWFAIASTGVGGESDQSITRVYRVSDLVAPIVQYPFRGVRLPGAVGNNSLLSLPGAGGMGGIVGGGTGGGMMGGMGGGMGGGFFQVTDGAAQSGYQTPLSSSPLHYSVSELIETIQGVIQPDSWSDVGGAGVIQDLGGNLVISQSIDVHAEISELIDQLRAERSDATVTVRAYWLPLVDGEVPKVAEPAGATHQYVDRDWLKQKTATHGARAQISGTDGQTVHLVAGNLRTSLTGVVPVVGALDAASPASAVARAVQPKEPIQKDVLAQIGELQVQDVRHTRVGYKPLTTGITYGALLQVTPTVLSRSGNGRVLLDLQSSILRPHGDGEDQVEFPPTRQLDKLNLVAQQFMSTLTVPIEKAVLVGGSSVLPMANHDEDVRVYLVVEVALD